MKTDTLIDMLARSAGPAPTALVAGRLLPAVMVGLVVSVTAAVAVFGSVPAASFATIAPWMKLAYAGALALAAGWLTASLSRPGAPVRGAKRALVAIVLLMGFVAADGLATTSPGARVGALPAAVTTAPAGSRRRPAGRATEVPWPHDKPDLTVT